MSKNKKLDRRDVRRLPNSDFIGHYTGTLIRSGPMTLAAIWGRSCGDKIGYDNRLDAVKEALLMEEQHRRPFGVYPCGCCGKFHVGGVK